MASGGGSRRRRKDDKQDEPGLGTILAVGAVAAGVAALTYGAKKLYDYVNANEPKPMPEDEGGYEPHGGNPGPSYRAYDSGASPEGRPLTHGAPHQRKQPQKPENSNLADQLEAYYDEYVCIPPEEMTRALEVVESVKSSLLQYLNETADDFSIGSLINTGSAFEDLAVVSPESFDLLLPLTLNPDLWNVAECSDAGKSCYIIKRQNYDSSPKGSTFFDQFLIGDSLSTELLLCAFTMWLEDFITQRSTTGKQSLKMAKQGPTNIEITYDNGKVMKIELNPSVCLQGVVLIANPRHVNPVLWGKSFSLSENKKLRSMDPVQCCHLKCLKIFKAIRLNHPSQFGIVDSYIYKMVLLHMMNDTPEEELWGHQCLQEQFVDMLNQLVYYLQGRNLPHMFDPELNLLEGTSTGTCDGLVSFILNRIGKEKLHTLLVRDYGPSRA